MNNRIYDSSYHSPIGEIYILANENSIIGISIDSKFSEESVNIENDVIKQCKKELNEYFNGKRNFFQVPIYYEGTIFQKKVWEELLKIPYGKVKSYKDIAESIGNPKAVRAVGGANKKNPIPLIIPCHRVIKSDGKLGGYMGIRTDIKEYLLKLEGK